jgi:hypothetical protein
MPKYDAFGREIGEDPLAGWRAEEAAPREAVPDEPAPAPAPAAESAPVDPPRAAAPPERPRLPSQRVVRIEMPRRRRPRVVARLIILLVVLGLGASLAVNGGRELEDAIRDIPPVEAEGPPPVGLERGSLVRPAELRRAFAQLQDANLGRVYTLRLAPERIDAQLITGGGVRSSVQLRHDGCCSAE